MSKKKTMYKRLTSPNDGTKIVTYEGKLHNWEGPALYPQGNLKGAEYYLYGIQHSKEEWKAAKSDHTGLPWYKNPGLTTRF
tara:strand:+ start:1772 stop:2014 length:243 start_codon:yes stop_codon:yes gene_type:complete